MKFTSYKIAITFVTLFLIFLFACNRTDVSQFINKEEFEKEDARCQYSSDKFCALQPSFRKVEQFCSEQKLSSEKCENIKIEVVRKATEFRNERIKETKKQTEQIKDLTK
jgi:hypothetical protein